ncbi:hypothetical protein ACFUIW_33675 [Streptomyces sp. NPDC057245]|uniref:hypothetical protein n=1 Tax=Streptomyces sp. NPDC057245 TaxID=3346065 RepID=UPI003632E5E9
MTGALPIPDLETTMKLPDAHPSVFLAGREKARTKLRELLGEHVAPEVADQISDAALTAALELVAANRIATPGNEGYGEPVHWATYNAMHQRALRAEYALKDAGVEQAPNVAARPAPNPS